MHRTSLPLCWPPFSVCRSRGVCCVSGSWDHCACKRVQPPLLPVCPIDQHLSHSVSNCVWPALHVVGTFSLCCARPVLAAHSIGSLVLRDDVWFRKERSVGEQELGVDAQQESRICAHFSSLRHLTCGHSRESRVGDCQVLSIFACVMRLLVDTLYHVAICRCAHSLPSHWGSNTCCKH